MLNNSITDLHQQPTIACVSVKALPSDTWQKPPQEMVVKWVHGCRVTLNKFVTRLCFYRTLRSETPENIWKPLKACAL